MAKPRRGTANEETVLTGTRLLVVEARFYDDIADMLLKGARRALKKAGAAFDRVTVPGALEIPPAIAIALDAAAQRGKPYDGVVALGCVIRGETSHYDTVCNNTNHWLMDIATRHAIPLGNAILTFETEAQALERAQGGRDSKGAGAVRACLTLIEHARAFARVRP
jgi:6,7-dimethyl-8-ribityllumazine synthase